MPYQLPEGTCGICDLLASPDAVAVETSEHAVALVAPWMRTRGATIVASRRHAPTMFVLPAAELHDVFRTAQGIAAAVCHGIDPDGLHFWWDTGVLAGQVEPHFFIEVVPRYADQDYSYTPLDELPSHEPAVLRAGRADVLRGMVTR